MCAGILRSGCMLILYSIANFPQYIVSAHSSVLAQMETARELVSTVRKQKLQYFGHARYQGPEPQHSYTRGKNRREEKQRSSKKTLAGRHLGLDGEATGGVATDRDQWRTTVRVSMVPDPQK